MNDQIDWPDGRTPHSRRFGDPYFSVDDGLAETRHVFLAGNDLPARFHPGMRIGELGFGTGLNFLVTWDAWNRSGCKGTLHFTSFEAYPMSPDDAAQSLVAFPELARLSLEFLAATERGLGTHHFDGNVVLDVIKGDARDTLQHWPGMADAWFLDGFSPAKNPEMWEYDLLAEVAAHTKKSGTLATYTAAGEVRRSLEAAGFDVTRAEGYGRKRHMTRAIKR